MRFLRRRREARRREALSEAECYSQCHGVRSGLVRVVRREEAPAEQPSVDYWPRPFKATISGEELRRALAERLDLRRKPEES